MIRLNLEGHLCRIAVIDRDGQWRGQEQLRNRHKLEPDKINQASRPFEWSRVDMAVFRVALLRCILDVLLTGKARGWPVDLPLVVWA